MVILKIIIAVIIYLCIITLFSIFLKGATQLGNEFDEKREAERLLKKLK